MVVWLVFTRLHEDSTLMLASINCVGLSVNTKPSPDSAGFDQAGPAHTIQFVPINWQKQPSILQIIEEEAFTIRSDGTGCRNFGPG